MTAFASETASQSASSGRSAFPTMAGVYPLPPGLGRFPILRVEDFVDCMPQLWRDVGGVFIPMYQREALWISFSAASWKPMQSPCRSVVSTPSRENPTTPGCIRNRRIISCAQTSPGWMASTPGLAQSASLSRCRLEQVTPLNHSWERRRLAAFKSQSLSPSQEDFLISHRLSTRGPVPMSRLQATDLTMGLGAGGSIRQKIYRDPYGVETWEPQPQARICVHIVNSLQFERITGSKPPATPIDAKSYSESSLPWFDLYDETLDAVSPPSSLATAGTVAERDAELGTTCNDDSFEVPDSKILKLHGEGGAQPSPASPRASAHKSEKMKGESQWPED